MGNRLPSVDKRCKRPRTVGCFYTHLRPRVKRDGSQRRRHQYVGGMLDVRTHDPSRRIRPDTDREFQTGERSVLSGTVPRQRVPSLWHDDGNPHEQRLIRYAVAVRAISIPNTPNTPNTLFRHRPTRAISDHHGPRRCVPRLTAVCSSANGAKIAAPASRPTYIFVVTSQPSSVTMTVCSF